MTHGQKKKRFTVRTDSDEVKPLKLLECGLKIYVGLREKEKAKKKWSIWVWYHTSLIPAFNDPDQQTGTVAAGKRVPGLNCKRFIKKKKHKQGCTCLGYSGLCKKR